MQVVQVMSRDVGIVAPDASLREAGERMDDAGTGVLPVCDGLYLLGVLTDRDLALRATTVEGSPDVTRVIEVMSREPRWCRASAEAEQALRRMSELGLRALPVVDEDGMLVGLVTHGRLSASLSAREALASRKSTASGP